MCQKLTRCLIFFVYLFNFELSEIFDIYRWILYTWEYSLQFYFCPFCHHSQWANLRQGKFSFLIFLNKNTIYLYIYSGIRIYWFYPLILGFIQCHVKERNRSDRAQVHCYLRPVYYWNEEPGFRNDYVE